MIIVTHLATLLPWVILLPDKFLKNHTLVDAFLIYLHKNSIGPY